MRGRPVVMNGYQAERPFRARWFSAGAPFGVWGNCSQVGPLNARTQLQNSVAVHPPAHGFHLGAGFLGLEAAFNAATGGFGGDAALGLYQGAADQL